MQNTRIQALTAEPSAKASPEEPPLLLLTLSTRSSFSLRGQRFSSKGTNQNTSGKLFQNTYAEGPPTPTRACPRAPVALLGTLGGAFLPSVPHCTTQHGGYWPVGGYWALVINLNLNLPSEIQWLENYLWNLGAWIYISIVNFMKSFICISGENLTSELTCAVSPFQISGMKNMYNAINNFNYMLRWYFWNTGLKYGLRWSVLNCV